MTLADLQLALDWAAAEGWNPGLEDAAALHAADPAGFLMGWVGEAPVAAISAIRHSPDFGFLGLYICHPNFRGQGYGWQIWQAAMQLFGKRTVGLDGVVEQQANYAKSGFRLSHNTMRYLGNIEAGLLAGFGLANPADVVGIDAQISGISRPRYMQSWFSDCKTRHTLTNDENTAFGTIRQCLDGFKIGPLYAPNTKVAKDLVMALVTKADAQNASVSIDAPSHNVPANELCQELGLEAVFSTARMYKGEAAPRPHPDEFGIATMELG
ncbi:MAG: GNAT family N-acetyltransferase [Rhodobacteraceae bacterium]|nr:GNAT family N-acetyltransferase [Paracoccaceae bacterium]